MNRPTNKVPELLLEQLHLGEIKPHDEAWLRTQLSDEEISARLNELRVRDERFHAQRDHARTVNEIEGRVRIARAQAEQRSRRPLTLPIALPALAAVVALFVVLRSPEGALVPSQEDALTTEDTTREKGLNAHLVVHRRVGDSSETLHDGDRAKRGDVLQVGYVAAQARHGVIVSLDGAGAVTLHFPDDERASTALVEDGEQLLSHAYELDAAPAFERFVFVTSTHPIAVKAVLDAAKSIAKDPVRSRVKALALDSTHEQTALTLEKE